MPEGDTVWLAGRRLHDALAGDRLTRSDFRVPQLATADLTGRTVTEVVSRGKHLLTRVDDDLTLHTHFRMDGSWHLYRHGDRWRGGPQWQVRVLLASAGWQAVGYRLPIVELLPRDREDDAVGHLGPDVLGPDWDPVEAVARLTAQPHREIGDALLDQRNLAGVNIDSDTGPPPGEVEAVRRLKAQPNREIGDALLDQRNLAGIGNLYKAETLFVERVSPWRHIRDIDDLGAIVRRARRLLWINREHPWQVTTGVNRRGQEHWVFERAGRPCRRCGTPIRSASQGSPPYDRLTYWCPTCQR